MNHQAQLSTDLRRKAVGLLASCALLLTPVTHADPSEVGLSESELIALVVGKTADDVRGALGEPQQIRKGRAGVEHWFYQSLVRIGRSNERFHATEVVISSGQVNHLMNHARMPGAE